MDKIAKLVEFYDRWKLTIDVDLLGGVFLYDPMLYVVSPTFPRIEDLEKWILANIDNMEDRLDEANSVGV